VKSSFQTRCLILCSILVIGLSVLSGRLVQIQLVDRQRYAESSRRTSHRVEKLPAIRGMIVDRREEPLAKSIPVSTVILDKKILMDPKMAACGLAYQEASAEPGWNDLNPEKQARRIKSLRGEILAAENGDVIVQKYIAYAVGVLARPLGLRREELRAMIEEKHFVNGKEKTWIPIVKELPEDVADSLREIIARHWIDGFEFQNSIKRWYTSEKLATHLTGFTGEIDTTGENGKPETKVVGRFGVEYSMEDYLAGRDGWREHNRDQRGLVVPGNSASLMPPRAGLNVQLTIDMGLQAIVEEELDAGLAEFKSELGAVVLMDPKTGEILAMTSRPNFDLNRREGLGKDGNGAGFNFAIQGVYEPGSTFKVIATSGVLNEGLATPFTSVFCHNGLYTEGKLSIPDHKAFGNLTLEGVLIKSSNIGAFKFARQLGPKRFYEYTENWGFGRKTGIQLVGESSGIARNTNNAVDFSRASYGYALNVTPLQMACAYSAIANDGKLLKPRIIKSLVANDGTVVETFPTEVVSQVIKPATARKMREALQKVTEKGGTATKAVVPGYKTAGKTGTAKKIKPGGGYFSSHYTVSFAGMLPAQDPAFVCLVVIDDPLITGINIGGGSVAAPIFQKIAARAAAYMNLQPTEPVTPPLASAER
jgi:cell division protein FtsI/penicillin-binding protein 2